MIQNHPHKNHPSATALSDFRCMACLVMVILIVASTSLALIMTDWAD